MKRFLSLLLILCTLLGCVGLTACGNSDTGENLSETETETTDNGTEETLTRIVDICFYIIVAQDYILIAPILARGPQSHNPASEVRHLHCEVAGCKGVERHLLAVNFCLEGRCRNKFRFFY